MKQTIKLRESELKRMIAESVKRVLNEQEITTYQNPTQTWQGQNNYMSKLNQVLKLSQNLGLNEITNFVQQKIQQLYKAQSNNFQR